MLEYTVKRWNIYMGALTVNDVEVLQYITTQIIKFSVKNFFSKCEQIRRKLRICTHLLKES